MIVARTNIGRRLVQAMQEEIRALESTIGDGAAVDYPHYRHIVGIIQGIKQTLQRLDEIEGEG